MAEIRLEPMTEAQYLHFRETIEEDYARQIAESGDKSWPAAVEKATQDFQRVLPDGMRTPDQHFFQAYDGAAGEVGMIWLQIAVNTDGLQAWVYNIEVEEKARRHGYGRAIMRAAETECRSRGVVSIGLNVFGGNTGARALYEQEGYATTSVQMRKHL